MVGPRSGSRNSPPHRPLEVPSGSLDRLVPWPSRSHSPDRIHPKNSGGVGVFESVARATRRENSWASTKRRRQWRYSPPSRERRCTTRVAAARGMFTASGCIRLILSREIRCAGCTGGARRRRAGPEKLSPDPKEKGPNRVIGLSSGLTEQISFSRGHN